MSVQAFFRGQPRVPVRNAEGVVGAAVFGAPKRDGEPIYRYTLLREWSKGRRSIAFVGVNPSKATESEDDLTVKSCWQFAQRWGYDRMVMLNAFAVRSTDPNGIHEVDDPVGPENDAWLLRVHGAVERTVAAWGNNIERVPGRHQQVLAVLAKAKTPVHAFRVTNDGYPLHPLARGKHRLKKTAETVPFVDRVVA